MIQAYQVDDWVKLMEGYGGWMRKPLRLSLAPVAGAFQVIFKTVKECEDTNNTSCTRYCYHLLTKHTIYACKGKHK